ncbi:amidohydrolase family protein [Amycolatopsis pithecellobii]|uniref:Amidohydrolase family protein n=1 Tax=Amycolatopsis pithecellobii TaxID=664692 RepID=A0A6N7YZR9_9PSEU|nr:amidohydrolase family protein [Amycolatopsis pithecellobii]MTD52594.1 amidohydrolase family protein [Amycolatopsis pithecellobii]
MTTAIRNVRVFDGHGLSEPTTVIVDGAILGGDTTGARTVDGHGATLLPGLIDAHIHLDGRGTLEQLARWGVTTGLDMTTWPPAKLAGLRGVAGVTDIRSAGTPVIGPDGPHARLLGRVEGAVLREAGQAPQFVDTRLAQGSDYLKVVLEAPGEGGPDADAARALVRVAHERGALVVAHAASPGAFTLATDIGVDVITHVPLGAPLDAQAVAAVVGNRAVSVPTLTMMKAIADNVGKPEALAGALATVAALHAAGVPVLAGTDANTAPGTPAHVKHGESIHHELELLVDAGLSPVEALRSATSLPARYFRLPDRGAITSGLRADLVLVEGDPTTDIRATRDILRVWCGGIELEPF